MQKNKIRLLNPLKEDFSTTYDINGDKNPIEFTAKAGLISTFNEIVGKHMLYHLTTAIINNRNMFDNDDIRREIAEEIVKP